MVSFKFGLRKSRNNLVKTLSLLPLIIVGTMFFIILFTIVNSYESSANKYFDDYNYADYTLYGKFNDDTIKNLNISDATVEGRFVSDYKLPDKTVRVISLSEGVNNLYLNSGSLTLKGNECLILERNAKALNKKVGDDFIVNEKPYKIAGLVSSPEYIYLFKDEKSVMNEANKFVVIYLRKESFSGNYNEILIKSSSALSETELIAGSGALYALSKTEQINYNLYKSDLDEISSFAYIFPVLFLIIIGVIIFVILKRTVYLERKSIATMKALGAGNGKIAFIYLTQFVLIAIVGVILGCVLGMFLTDTIIFLFSSMFVVPGLKFVFYPLIWLTALIVMLSVTLLSGIISLIGVFKLEPAEAMRPINNSKSKSLLIEKTRVYKKLSFNSRYALKNTMRNKGRFFASVMAIAFSLALLMLSSGFMDSITGTKNAFFTETANYDLIVSLDVMPYEVNDDVINYGIGEHAKVLELTEKINGENIPVKIVDKDFSMINLPSEIENGIIIPTYFAEKWKVKKGDSLNVGGINYTVGAVNQQYVGLAVYCSYDYAKSVNQNFVKAYNSIYVKTGTDGLINYLTENDRFYSTIKDDMSVFDNISGSVKILIALMTACAIILGVFALYSIGLINLSSREHEYAQLNALGYSEFKILLTQIKETILQFLLALPIGLLGGNLLLFFIKGEFSNQSFCLKPTIFFTTYLLSIALVIVMLVGISFVAFRQIKKINIVEKLKSLEG